MIREKFQIKYCSIQNSNMLGLQDSYKVNLVFLQNQKWNLYAEAGLLLFREVQNLIMAGRILEIENT